MALRSGLRKVVVVTRTRSRPRMLERALKSICSQSLKDLVWVIVNDGGDASATEKIADVAQQAGIKTVLLHHATSKGMEAASNAGIRRVASDYIAIHDDDDSWEPEFLQATTNFLESRKQYVGVITHVTAIDERLREDNIEEVRRKPHYPRPHAIYLADLTRVNVFQPIAFLYRRSLFETLGGYDESMPVLGDWDFNLRATMIGDIGVIPRPLANYHQRLDGGASDYANTVTAQRDLHHATEAHYRNRLLREDLKSGKMGLGTLLAIGRLQSRSGLHQPKSAMGGFLDWLRRN